MGEKFTPSNTTNNEVNHNTDESLYEDLIIRLQEIKTTIALLEKKYLDKFFD